MSAEKVLNNTISYTCTHGHTRDIPVSRITIDPGFPCINVPLCPICHPNGSNPLYKDPIYNRNIIKEYCELIGMTLDEFDNIPRDYT